MVMGAGTAMATVEGSQEAHLLRLTSTRRQKKLHDEPSPGMDMDSCAGWFPTPISYTSVWNRTWHYEINTLLLSIGRVFWLTMRPLCEYKRHTMYAQKSHNVSVTHPGLILWSVNAAQAILKWISKASNFFCSNWYCDWKVKGSCYVACTTSDTLTNREWVMLWLNIPKLCWILLQCARDGWYHRRYVFFPQHKDVPGAYSSTSLPGIPILVFRNNDGACWHSWT